MKRISINGRPAEIDMSDDTPLLWALRDGLKLNGTKYGCGIGLCGACTVHVNGAATRACFVTLGDMAEGDEVTTIEGLHPTGEHPLQLAWIEEQTPQCGYCQSGQIMQAADLLARNPDPSDEDILAAMSGNICRCMTYGKIKSAIKRAART